MRRRRGETVERRRGENQVKGLTHTMMGLGLLFAIASPLAAHAIEGSGMVDAVRLGAEPVIVLNGEDYRVTENTILEGREGERLTLQTLPSAESGGTVDETSAWFDWQGDPRHRILNELKIRDTD